LVHGEFDDFKHDSDRFGEDFSGGLRLGDKNAELEAQGVDLHLLKRALQSTHFQVADECFHTVLAGYALRGRMRQQRI
jgi:TP53 regulating kinase-like protein